VKGSKLLQTLYESQLKKIKEAKKKPLQSQKQSAKKGNQSKRQKKQAKKREQRVNFDPNAFSSTSSEEQVKNVTLTGLDKLVNECTKKRVKKEKTYIIQSEHSDTGDEEQEQSPKKTQNQNKQVHGGFLQQNNQFTNMPVSQDDDLRDQHDDQMENTYQRKTSSTEFTPFRKSFFSLGGATAKEFQKFIQQDQQEKAAKRRTTSPEYEDVDEEADELEDEGERDQTNSLDRYQPNEDNNLWDQSD